MGRTQQRHCGAALTPPPWGRPCSATVEAQPPLLALRRRAYPRPDMPRPAKPGREHGPTTVPPCLATARPATPRQASPSHASLWPHYRSSLPSLAAPCRAFALPSLAPPRMASYWPRNYSSLPCLSSPRPAKPRLAKPRLVLAPQLLLLALPFLAKPRPARPSLAAFYSFSRARNRPNESVPFLPLLGSGRPSITPMMAPPRFNAVVTVSIAISVTLISSAR